MHLLINSVYKGRISVNKYIAFGYAQSETADIVIIVRHAELSASIFIHQVIELKCHANLSIDVDTQFKKCLYLVMEHVLAFLLQCLYLWEEDLYRCDG